jgi:hypothetical protein
MADEVAKKKLEIVPEVSIAPVTVGDPYAIDDLAIDQAHLEELVKPDAESSVVESQKPEKGVFFTVRPEPSKPWKDRGFYWLLEVPGRDSHIVAPAIAAEKKDEEDTLRPVLIVRYVTMAGEEGLWPLKLNPPEGKSNAWNTSALNILEIAASGKWVRIVSAKKHYRHQVSKKTFAEVPPKYTDRSFKELIDCAYKDRVIATLDHAMWDVLKDGSTK